MKPINIRYYVDPETEKVKKTYTGWAPIDLIELKERDSFLVFNSEDQFAEVRADGSFEMHTLPYDYPVRAIYSPENDVYLSYGPHQSYWPTVYIWDAKNGILTIDKIDLSFLTAASRARRMRSFWIKMVSLISLRTIGGGKNSFSERWKMRCAFLKHGRGFH